MGNLEGILRDFFLTHGTQAQKFRGKFRREGGNRDLVMGF